MLPQSPRPRAADDFATIRSRMEELRRERAEASADEELGSVIVVRRDPATARKPGLLPAIRRAILKAR